MAKPHKTILVTGGAGFIGSNTVTELLEAGHTVRVVDDLSFGFKKFLDPRAEFFKGSIADAKLLDTALHGVDVVMHFAASSIIQSSLDEPLAHIENNVMNGTRLLEGMRRNGVKKVIFSSSASVYGEPIHVPIREDHQTKPLQPYGASKRAFEAILSAYHHSFGIESVSLRFFNVYGPQDEQKPATRAVPRWIKSCLKGEPITLNWGGRQLRDYIFVRDVALAHIAVMDVPGCQTFNIGSGTGIIMKDLLERIMKLTRSESIVSDMAPRRGDPEKLVADTTAIFKAVGWKPLTGLEDGLKETIAFYKKSS